MQRGFAPVVDILQYVSTDNIWKRRGAESAKAKKKVRPIEHDRPDAISIGKKKWAVDNPLSAERPRGPLLLPKS
jgi:hypothetical protein